MSKRLIVLLSLLLLLAVAGTGCGVLQETTPPSATIEAVPLEVATQVTEVTSEGAADNSAEPTVAAPDAAAPTADSAGAALIVYTIDPLNSRVRFELDEDLRGQRNTVVGETDQVAGEIALNLGDLSQAQVGTMQINARTLVTDSSFRNRAIQNQILDAGGFEFITFTPTSVDGLPATAAVGDEVEFTITGDLTIKDVTLPATFTVQANLVSDSQITGTASTVITRTDYDLRIPSVPNVANVEDEVELYIDFTANAS